MDRIVWLLLVMAALQLFGQENREQTVETQFTSGDFDGVVAGLDRDFREHRCTITEYKFYAAAQMKRWEKSGELVQDFSRKFAADTRLQFAMTALDLASKQNAQDPEVSFLKGVASAQRHRWEEAENHLTAALRSNHSFEKFNYGQPLPLLLNVLKQQGKLNESELLASEATDRFSKRELLEVAVLQGEHLLVSRRYDELLKNMTAEDAAKLFADAAVIAGDDEKAAWLESNNPAKFLRSFWKKRDPNLADEANERLTEHYRRLMHARNYYTKSLDRSLLDDRGLTYVRLGSPSRIFYGNQSSTMKEYESWVYSELGLHFDFVQKYHDYESAPITDAFAFGATPSQHIRSVDAVLGDLRYEHLDYFRMAKLGSNPFLAEQFAQQQFYNSGGNTRFQYFDAGRYLPINLNAKAACFRADEGMTRLDLYYMTPLKDLVFENDREIGKKFLTDIHVSARLFDEDFNELSVSEFDRTVEASETDIHRLYYVDEIRTVARPGRYLMAFEVRSGDKIGVHQFPIEIPLFDDRKLTVSDIQLAVQVGDDKIEQKFSKPGTEIKILPNPAAHVSKKRDLGLYYEIYGLTLDNEGASRYEVAYTVQNLKAENSFFQTMGRWFRGNRKTGLSSVTTNAGRGVRENEVVQLDIRDLPSGPARLGIRVKDLNSGIESHTALDLYID